jgi:N-acetylglucosaminyldiphosphoundecaprenol N-acetyl-beta-D-mannosaminyltransferase
MKRLSLNGIAIDFPTPHELAERIGVMLRGTRVYHIATINPEFIVEASRNPAFRSILATVDLATADGAGIILAAKLRGIPVRLSDRITGVTLTQLLLREAELRQYPVAVLLKSNSLVTDKRLASYLTEAYPSLIFAIHREPYDIAQIASRHPRILFSALGSPSQEFWIRDRAKEIPGVNIALGVGGTFDLLSGTIQHAPPLLRSRGLEWLWRLFKEPHRLPRILRATIVFPVHMMIRK